MDADNTIDLVSNQVVPMLTIGAKIPPDVHKNDESVL